MSMVNFDENQIIANGAKIYDQRAKIEAIADSIVDNGFDLLLFTSSGGSQAMLDPFAFYIRHMSRLPVENVLSANLMTGDCNRITNKTVAFLTSKSGDTAETVKAANWLKEQGVRLFAAVGKENSTLESICDDTIVYSEGRPQELVFYLLIGRILYRSCSFDAYPRFADELKNLAFALAQVRKQADAKCLKYAQDYCKEPYNIWIGSGDLWPTAYSYSMCVLEESQWIRTKSVSSPEFFHGTLELLEDDVCTTLLLTEGPTRAQDERVKEFAALLDIYNRYPIACLTIHPRVRKEKYRGPVHLDAFAAALEASRNPVCYNGDLRTVGEVCALEARFPSVTHVMIGRGLVADPALARKLRGGAGTNRKELSDFLAALYQGYTDFYQGQVPTAAQRMREVWFYLIHLFDDAEKLNKQLRRFRTPAEYERIQAEILAACPLRSDAQGDLI